MMLVKFHEAAVVLSFSMVCNHGCLFAKKETSDTHIHIDILGVTTKYDSD